MSPVEAIRAFEQRLRREYPSSNPRLESFPSGALILDVRVKDDTYVVQSLPSLPGVGVNRASAATYGWEGYEHAFDSAEEAIAFVWAALEQAK